MSMGMIVVMVIVVAMLVVMMVVIVMTAVIVTAVIIMVMMAVVAMIMLGVIVATVIVRRLRIGATFRVERRLNLDDPRAESLHHRLDDVISADAQAFWHDLGRQVAVAQMPGYANQMQRISAADFEQRLGGGHHLDQPAVLQHQRVAAA